VYELFLLFGLASLVVLVGPLLLIALYVRLQDARARLERLEREVHGLRGQIGATAATPAEPVTAPSPPASPPSAPAPPAAARIRERPAVPKERPRPERVLEEWVGGVGLQHVGSGLLLLGVLFFLIWGYTSGRVPPPVLVGAGVTLGAAFVWRGDRVGRAVRPFGHALIGTGIGIAYISIYLGHFLLHVLSARVAFPMLAATSLVAVVAGRHYGAQTIAALGILGAYLPELVADWIPLGGFQLTPLGLLAHLTIVNLVVFSLTASASWSGLALMSLLLAGATWLVTVPTGAYGWPEQLGLSALFSALGLSALPRLARWNERVAPLDLAVAAVAPLVLFVCSLPFLVRANRAAAAGLLLGLAAVHAGAAWWVGARRDDRPLWRPLSGAAVIFLAAALERAMDGEGTRVAWCAEAFVLIALGLGAGSGWLRFCGYWLGAGSLTWGLLAGLQSLFTDSGSVPFANLVGVRHLACIALALRAAQMLAAERPRLRSEERYTAELATAAAHALLMVWSAHQVWLIMVRAGLLADALYHHGYAWTGAAWMLQGAILVVIGLGTSSAFLRVLGYGIGAAALSFAFGGLGSVSDILKAGDLGHPSSAAAPILSVAILAGLAGWLAARRDALRGAERRMPEVITVGANLLAMACANQEAHAIGRGLHGADGVTASGPRGGAVFGAFLASVAWLAQALGLFTVGWWRGSAFLRWLGLGLFGVTVFKFLLVDLRGGDPLWRFAVAILAGVILLAISYLYQRRSATPPVSSRPPDTPG
jgi:uncharacterized membrane protein